MRDRCGNAFRSIAANPATAHTTATVANLMSRSPFTAPAIAHRISEAGADRFRGWPARTSTELPSGELAVVDLIHWDPVPSRNEPDNLCGNRTILGPQMPAPGITRWTAPSGRTRTITPTRYLT